MDSSKEFKLRPPKPSDLNFIQHSFLKSMRESSKLGRSCTTTVFFANFPSVVHDILDQSKIIIACKPDEEDVAFGYIIFEPHKCIHYIFVKAVFRNEGIAKALVTEAFGDTKVIHASFFTQDAKDISKSHPGLIHNPFILYQRKVSNEQSVS